MNDLGHKLKILRKSQKLKQEDLTCEFLNRTSLSKIENNLLAPSILQLKHLSEQLNVSVDYLLDEKKGINIDPKVNINSKLIEDLFSKDMLFEIIDKFKPYDFTTYYYVGMSYYKLDLMKDAEPLLDKCEGEFNSLCASEKVYNVENLCIALNSLRKIRVKDLKDIDNYKHLTHALKYLNTYSQNKCEIYYTLNNNIGVFFILNKQFDNAIMHYEQFFSTNSDFIASRVMASLHLNLSIAYFATKLYDKAINCLNKAIFFYNYINDEIQAGECYINLFNCYLYKNDISECRNIINYATKNFSHPELHSRFEVLELTLLYNTNDIENLSEKRKTVNYRTLPLSTKMDYHFIMARLSFISNNYTSAISHYNKCLSYLIDREKFHDLSIAYNDLYIVSGNCEFDSLRNEYHTLHLSAKYNNLSCNISSPHYNMIFDSELY